MCGRYVVARDTADLVSAFNVDAVGDNVPGPSWNLKPTQFVPAVIEAAKGEIAAVAAATPVAEALEFYPVGPLRGDGPELLEPIS